MHWDVDLMSTTTDMNVTFSRILADSAKIAEGYALRMMARPESWICVGTDRHRHSGSEAEQPCQN